MTAKLSDDKIIEIIKIRNEQNTSTKDLAIKFNVHESTIRDVINGKRCISKPIQPCESLPNEEWKDIVGHEHQYQVSNQGRIWSKLSERMMIQRNNNGYLLVGLRNIEEKGNKDFRVHRLVMEAFIGTCPDGHIVHHKDGNKTNNNISNLEYITYSENNLQHYSSSNAKIIRGSAHVLSKLNEMQVIEIKILLSKKVPHDKISKQFGVCRQTIGDIHNENTWKTVDINNYKEKIVKNKDDIINEIWLPIPDYSNYEISNLGNVWSIKNNIFLAKKSVNKYKFVNIRKESLQKTYSVHELVLLAFVGARPDGNVINHKNGNREDNRLENLEYTTRSQNAIHSQEILGKGHGETHGNSKFKNEDIFDIIDLYQNQNCTPTEIGYMYSVKRTTISNILTGKTWKHLTKDLISDLNVKDNRLIFSEEQVSEIRQLLKNQFSIKDIAKKYGCSVKPIKRILKMMN